MMPQVLPENKPFRKENHLIQTFISGFPCWLSAVYCKLLECASEEIKYPSKARTLPETNIAPENRPPQ